VNGLSAAWPEVPRRSAYALVAVVAMVAAFAFQGTRGLYASSETRYAECAREMLASGNWLEPTLAGEPHWTKPPLTYWAIAGGMVLLGRNEWAVRLYGAVAFALTVVGVTLLGRAMWNDRAGLVAGLVYATSPFAAGAANVATTDIVLALWEVLAVLAYWRAWRATEPSHGRVWASLMWAALALGFLTKGPPALLPLLAIVPFHLWRRRRAAGQPRLLSLPGLVLFGVVGLGWYAYAVWRHPGLAEYLLEDEFVERLATNRFGRNAEWYKPFLLYLPPLAVGLGAWMVFWPRALRRTWRGVRAAGLRAWLAARPAAVFLMLWLLVPLAVLFVVPSRLPLYVLPLMVVPALATARVLARQYAVPALGRYVWAVAAVSAALIVGGKAVIAYLPNRHDSRPLAKAMLAQETPGARFAVFRRTEEYGLDFYLDGRVARIAESVSEGAPFDYDADAWVRRVHADGGRHEWVVAFKGNAGPLTDALDEAGVAYRTCEAWQRYGLLVTEPEAAASSSEGRRARKDDVL